MKYKWIVDHKPTGRYSSFEHRNFPTAEYKDGNVAAFITCEDAYRPEDVKSGRHKPLKLYIADHSVTPWKRRKIVKEYKTLQEAKDAFARVLKQHPEIIPKPKTSGLPSHLGF